MTLSPEVVLKVEMDEEGEEEGLNGASTAKNSEEHFCQWVLDNGELCGRSFTKFDSLRRHVEALHKGNRPHKCHSCDKSYGRKDYLDRHIMRVHEKASDEGMLPRPEAVPKTNIDEEVGGGSEEAAHDAEQHLCKWVLDTGYVCGKFFSRRDALRQHTRHVHQGIRPHRCHLCGKSYGRKDYLDRHLTSSHENDYPENLLSPDVILKVESDEECLNDTSEGGSMPDPDEAPVAFKRQKLNGKEICTWELEDGSVCGRAFTKFDSLKQHRKQIHNGIRPHACHLCGKSYGRRDYLDRHIILSHEKANKVSSIPNPDGHLDDENDCPENLLSPDVILNVETDEEGDGWLNDTSEVLSVADPDDVPVAAKCQRLNGKKICNWELEDGSICDKSFKKSDSLKRHRKEIHKGIRPYACHLCGKSYGRRDYLDRHIVLSHEKANKKVSPIPNPDAIREEKPKICQWILDDGEVCGKSFSRRDNLRLHENQVHKGIRPYSCHLCDMSYGRKDYLDRHIQVAHEKANGAVMLPSTDVDKEEVDDGEVPELSPGPQIVINAEKEGLNAGASS